MVRFYYRQRLKFGNRFYSPLYSDMWTLYDPNNTTNCSFSHSWKDVWQEEPERDKLHRRNSLDYRMESKDTSDNLAKNLGLAWILLAVFLACLTIPQLVDLLMTLWRKHKESTSPAPPTPPTPPSSRKQLKLYHYAQPISDHGVTKYYYDPDAITNYVSETRIQALAIYNELKELEAL